MKASVKIFAAYPGDAATLHKMVPCINDLESLKRAFIVSDVDVTSTADLVKQCAHVNGDGNYEQLRFFIGIDKVLSPKCHICWHYDSTVGAHLDHQLIFIRCNEATV